MLADLRTRLSRLDDAMPFAGTPRAWTTVLRRHPDVRQLRTSLKMGALAHLDVSQLVREFLADFRQGQRFTHEVALAAIAVALEEWPSPFAERFLRELAALDIAEMPMSSRVARSCLVARSRVAGAAWRSFPIADAVERRFRLVDEPSVADVSDFTLSLDVQAAEAVG